MLSVVDKPFKLSVVDKPFKLSVVMLSVIVLTVVAPRILGRKASLTSPFKVEVCPL